MADEIPDVTLSVEAKQKLKGMFTVLIDMASMDPVPAEELRKALEKYSADIDVMETFLFSADSVTGEPQELPPYVLPNG